MNKLGALTTGVIMALSSVVWAQSEPAAPAGTDPAAETAAPKIVCDQMVYNFGERKNDQDVEHAYVIKNEGNATLEIKQARASCGCTVANIANKTVPPGEETTITAKLNLRGRLGPQHKTITVDSNDPRVPALVLTLEGNSLAADAPTGAAAPNSENAAAPEAPAASAPPVERAPPVTDFLAAPTEISIEEGAQNVSRDVVIRTATPFEIKGIEMPQPTIQNVTFPMKPNGFRIQLNGINGTSDLAGKAVKILTTLPDHPEVLFPIRLIPKPQ